ncbi:uncharacterized protein V6R79_015760 [Siganus canaliculatus]
MEAAARKAEAVSRDGGRRKTESHKQRQQQREAGKKNSSFSLQHHEPRTVDDMSALTRPKKLLTRPADEARPKRCLFTAATAQEQQNNTGGIVNEKHDAGRQKETDEGRERAADDFGFPARGPEGHSWKNAVVASAVKLMSVQAQKKLTLTTEAFVKRGSLKEAALQHSTRVENPRQRPVTDTKPNTEQKLDETRSTLRSEKAPWNRINVNETFYTKRKKGNVIKYQKYLHRCLKKERVQV